MEINEKLPSLRQLMLITTPQLTEKAIDLFRHENLPIQYKLNAQGTASSEIMDMLGLGSIDKNILISIMPKPVADTILRKLYSELKMHTANSGIAFTVPLTGVSSLIMKMLMQTQEESLPQSERKDENIMTDIKYSLIAAVVNRGYSGNVMDAAREAGAGGGTVIHSLEVSDEKVSGVWGLGVRDEKEIVLILSDAESKVRIMRSISEACGAHSKAKGLVVSLPIDAAMGLQRSAD